MSAKIRIAKFILMLFVFPEMSDWQRTRSFGALSRRTDMWFEFPNRRIGMKDSSHTRVSDIILLGLCFLLPSIRRGT